MFKKALVVAAVAAFTSTSAFAGCCKDCDCDCPKKMTPEAKQEKMQKMVEELDARLQLTDEQKVQVTALREAKHKKMIAQKKKIDKIRAQKTAVKNEIKSIHEQFMADFKAVLTADQLAELDKIKQEHKEKFEAKKAQ